MITNIYIENNSKKKSNLKPISMFDPQASSSLDAERKSVSFSSEDTNYKKRKLPNGIQNEQQVNKQNTSNKKLSSSSSSAISALANDLIKSPINFESFACDQELKENIFRRIYYILSPEHFQQNGKIPPRGFLLHGPPGCGKTQLVYAIAGVIN